MSTTTTTTTTPIHIPYPETRENLHLHISVGACSLRLVPRPGDDWVSGSYEDPSGLLPTQILSQGQTARILQEPFRSAHWGSFAAPPRFLLSLSNRYPFMLTLETGASEGSLDLGGLPLRRVVIRWGAGKGSIDFSEPDPVSMSLLDVTAGAVSLELHHLGQANCAEMNLSGGAAAYVLDFVGNLQQDMHARVSTGLSSVEIRIPVTTPARVSTDSFLGSLQVSDGFSKNDGAFQNELALQKQSPQLVLSTSLALGALQLRLMK